MRVIIAADDRPPGSAPLPGSRPAYTGSLLAHAALLLCLILVSSGPGERESTQQSTIDRDADLTSLVWMPASGVSGGGGGGGNRNPDPPRRLQRVGTDRVSTPMVVRTVLGSAQPEPTEQTIVAPALVPLAGGSTTLPGALEPASFPDVVSLGAGTNGGAGSGREGGLGDGAGSGLYKGSGGDFGGGRRGTGGNIRPPVIVRNVRPQYTTEAMRARIQGSVLVAATVEADGTVRDARVVRSLDPVFGLDQSALRAARDWLFRPATMDGKPVALAVTIELVFSLR